MQKTEVGMQRRTSEQTSNKTSPMPTSALVPPTSNFPFPGQQGMNPWQNPYLQAMASKFLLGNNQSPLSQFQAAHTNMFNNPLLGNPTQALLAQYQRMMATPAMFPSFPLGFPQNNKPAFFPNSMMLDEGYLKNLANKNALSPNSIYSGSNTTTEPSNSPTESSVACDNHTTPPLLPYQPQPAAKLEPATPESLPGNKQVARGDYSDYLDTKVPTSLLRQFNSFAAANQKIASGF